MKLKNILGIGLIVVIALVALVYFLQQKNEPEVIKIGVIQPLTGELANFGKTVVNGIQLAVDDYKDSVKEKIQLIIEDSKGEPNSSVSAFSKLMSVNKVKFVIGDLTSSSTLAIAPIAVKNNILLISPTASNPALSKAGEYFFRVWPSDNYSGYVAAAYSFNKLGSRKVAIIYINNDYGIGLKDVFKDTFEKLGGNVLLIDSYSQNQTDFKNVLIKSKRNNVDLIYIPGHPYGIANALKQAKELKIKLNFFSDVAAEDKDFTNIAGNAAQGLYFVTPSFDLNSQDKIVMNFVDKFKKKYNELPDIHAVKGYEAAYVLLDGITHKKLEPNELGQYLKQKLFYSISGELKFDKSGDVISNSAIKIYQTNTSIKILDIYKP